MGFKYDCCGYVTKNDLLCTDGRTIRAGAFDAQDGEIVPLLWNHDHVDMSNVIGHALLEKRNDGIYGYLSFNDTDNGVLAKKLVEHGDVKRMSIYANQLKQRVKDVVHGVIREVSLVYAAANPGAFIDSVIAHGDGIDEEAIMYIGEDLVLCHGEVGEEKKPEEKKDEPSEDSKETIADIIDNMTEEKKTVAMFIIGQALGAGAEVKHSDEEEKAEELPKGKTVKDVWDTFTENEKAAVYAIVGTAKVDEKSDDEEKSVEHNDNEEDTIMHHNAFDESTNVTTGEGVLTHSDQVEILKMARQQSCGSLREAITQYSAEHDHLQHGIDEIETLFPDYKDAHPGAPEIITDDQTWVSKVMGKVHKSPISRLRTRQTDARGRKIRALGYKKGAAKKDAGNVKLLKRTTDPYTVYVKDALDRDDILDIEDFDVVNYEYGLLKMALNEEIATAIMVSDGREEGDDDKIPEDKIRPIWQDDELYTIHKAVDFDAMKTSLQGTDTSKHFGDDYIKAEAILANLLEARRDYRGSGSGDLFIATPYVNAMLLARDLNGRRIYNTIEELRTALNVNSIITVDQWDGLERENDSSEKFELIGIYVNLNDYWVGAVKGGQITQFNQFDIQYNKERVLLEARMSGALTKVKSAIALEVKTST